MKSNAETPLTERDLSANTVYTTSNAYVGTSNWIQESITHQVLDSSRLSLIDGIYVQTLSLEASIELAYKKSEIENQIAAMASDPDIQQEIESIRSEFADTEMDGLSED